MITAVAARGIIWGRDEDSVGIKCQEEPEIGSNDYAVMLQIFISLSQLNV